MESPAPSTVEGQGRQPVVRRINLDGGRASNGNLHRPRRYWSRLYASKQENQPEKDEESAGENKVNATRRIVEDLMQNVAVPRVSHFQDLWGPPPTPRPFHQVWLSNLTCEGCCLPATANTVMCKHCNVVTHYWCRDVRLSRRDGRRKAIVPRDEHPVRQKLMAELKGSTSLIPDEWVCWECEEDMMSALQRYRTRKDNQLGALLQREAAKRITRFMIWVATMNRRRRSQEGTIKLQSFIRMRIRHVRFKMWRNSQKRAMTIAVRSISGLPGSDPTSRKRCNPFVIITATETDASSDSPGRRVQTFFHRLSTKKGDSAVSALGTFELGKATRGGKPNPSATGTTEVGGGKGNENLASGGDQGYIFHWEEECLLPGVPSTATIVFTVLHQAPTRVVCLGQACVSPLSCNGEGGYMGTVSLAPRKVRPKTRSRFVFRSEEPVGMDGGMLTPGKRAGTYKWYPPPETIICPQIAIFSQRSAKRPSEEFRMDDAQLNKPGQLTFFIRKSHFCDSHCGDVLGPRSEEIRALTRSEGQAERRTMSNPPCNGGTPGTGTAQNNSSRPVGASGVPRRAPPASSIRVPHPKSKRGQGDTSVIPLTTSWWMCVWLGNLRLYRKIGDPQPKLTLNVGNWNMTMDEERREKNANDVLLTSKFDERRLSLRCRSTADALRWKDVFERNQEDQICRQDGVLDTSKQTERARGTP